LIDNHCQLLIQTWSRSSMDIREVNGV